MVGNPSPSSGGRPIPICHLRFSDVVGGVETHILALLAALDPTRYRATVLCLPNPLFEQRLAAAGIPFQVIPRRGKWDWRFVLRIRHALARTRCCLIHTHGLFSDFYGALACRMTTAEMSGIRAKPRHVLTKHTFPEADMSMPARKVKFFYLLDHWVTYPRVDRFVAVSEDRKRGLIEKQGVRPERISVIYNGLSLDRAGASARPALRRELGLAPQVPIVGFIGRLNREKGPDLFVQAMAHLVSVSRRLLPADPLFVIVGDGPMKPRLLAMVQALGLAERFRFLPYRDEIGSLIADMDAVVMSSRTEGFPMLLLELMAHARPIIAARVGGIPEAIEDGCSGWLVPQGDTEAIARCVLEALAHPDMARERGHAARNRFANLFTSDKMAQKMMDLYDEVLLSGRHQL